MIVIIKCGEIITIAYDTELIKVPRIKLNFTVQVKYLEYKLLNQF